MNYLFFHRRTGEFGELALSGIKILLERYSIGNVSETLDKLPKLKAGQYCYAGSLVLVATVGGVR